MFVAAWTGSIDSGGGPALDNDYRRFLNVEKWVANLTIEFDLAETYAEADGAWTDTTTRRTTFRASGSVTFALAERDQRPVTSGTPGRMWRQPAGGFSVKLLQTEEGNTISERDPRLDDNQRWESMCHANGESEVGGDLATFYVRINPQDEILPNTCQLDIMTAHDLLFRYLYVRGDGWRREEQSPGSLTLRISNLPLPAQGDALIGSRTIPMSGVSVDEDHFWINASPTLGTGGILGTPLDPEEMGKATITWHIVPVYENDALELRVEIDEYADWTPRGGNEEGEPGRQLNVRARLQTKSGGTPPELADKIIFELIEVSREPGTCINFPSRDACQDPPLPDLRFHPEYNVPNGLAVVDVDELRAETPPGQPRAEAEAVISSHDWGAYATLRVTAEMPDGRVVVGHLNNSSRDSMILLPKRQPNSRIADYALERMDAKGLADDDDGEDYPVGDGFKGDGLTLYEEYRGFYERGVHQRGSADTKDFFLHSAIGSPSERGILTFSGLTGLRVHYMLRRDELDEDRVINFNRSGRTQRETVSLLNLARDQHGVIMESGVIRCSTCGQDMTNLNMSSSCPVAGCEGRAESGTSRARGGPGTPKSINRVIIRQPRGLLGGSDNGAVTRTQDVFAHVIVHELLHCVNVPHHGDSDQRQCAWTNEALEDGTYMLTEGGKPITIKSEAGEVLPFGKNGPERTIRVYLAVQQGQHSGDQGCRLRYIFADAYPSRLPNDCSTRFWVKGTEILGASLCDSPDGTGVNDSSHRPHSRYGNATMGGCRNRIRVSDR